MSFRWPVDSVKISQGFGNPNVPFAQYGTHNGIDLAVPAGTKVYAPDEGVVEFEGWGQNHSWFLQPAGILVMIHVGGSYTAVAHLQSTVVNKGQKVKKGQLVGYAGSTGAATGPHVHFEMLPLKPNFKNGLAGRIDPTPYMDKAVKNATADEIKKAYKEILERTADAAGLKHYAKYPILFVRDDLKKSEEKRKLDAKKAAAALAESNRKAAEAKKAADAKKAAEAAAKAKAELDRIAKEEAAAALIAEEKNKSIEAIVKQNNTLLNTIVELLQKLLSVFNLGGK